MAAVNAVYLLTEACGDFAKAVKIGHAALRRFPASAILANNVAYALALSGDLSAAKAVLPARDSLPHVKATRGLIDFLSGRTEEGLELYDQAAAMAEDLHDIHTAAAVRYRKALLVAANSEAALPQLPAGYEADVNFQLQRLATEKTRQVVATSRQQPLLGFK
jgi:tetratricopeptide (TPR) repeat protein